MPSEAFSYHEIFDACPIAATLVDGDTVIVDVNRAFIEYTGSLGLSVRREERVGRHLGDFAVAAHERNQIVEMVRAAVRGGQTQHLRMRWPSPGGDPAFLDVQVRPVVTREGEITGAVVLRHQVSEQQWLERRAQVVGRVRDEVWKMEHSGDVGRVLQAVRAGLSELGIPFDGCTVSLVEEGDGGVEVTAYGTSAEGTWHEGTVEEPSRKTLETIWRGKEPVYRRDLERADPFGEAQLLARYQGKRVRAVVDVPLPQGTLAINSTEADAFSPGDIDVLREMAAVLSEGWQRRADFEALEERNRALQREVAERRQAEAALEEERQRLAASEARYRQLVDNLPIGIAHTTPEGRTLYINPWGRRILGYGEAPLEKLRATELYVYPEDRQDLVRSLSERGEHSFEYLLRRRDGETAWVRGATRAVRDAAGHIAEYQGYLEDVTEERRQETTADALRLVRDAIWRMRRTADIQHVLQATEESLTAWGIDYHGLGVNIVDDSVEPPRVTYFETTRDHDRGRWDMQVQTPEDFVITDTWRRGEPCYRPDLEADDPFDERRGLEQDYGSGIRAVVDVPFAAGTLAVNSRQAHAFPANAVAFLEALVQVLAEGFQRLRDLEELERRAVEAEALARAIGSVAGSRDLQEALQTVAEEAARLMACERASLFLFDEDEGALVPRAQIGHDWEHYRHIRLEPGESVSGRVYATAEPAMGVDDPSTFPLRDETRAHFLASLGGRPAGSGSAVPLRLDGEVIGVLAVGRSLRAPGPRDIELLERLGEQAILAIDRARRSRELEERARDLEDQIAAGQRLEEQLLQAQKMEAIGQLTAGIAHNFNNLLQGVIGNLSLARDEVGDSTRSLLRDAEASALRGAEMVRQLLVFSRQSARPEYEPVDMSQLVGDALAICRKTFDRSIRLEGELAGDLPPALGHRGQLEQALLNLLINARDAVTEAGTRRPQIRVSASLAEVEEAAAAAAGVQPGPYVRVAVADNGPGMDEATRQQIFDPFFTTKEVGAGTGLGLSTVYGIALQHDGWVECEARPEAGAAFALYVPVATATAAPEAEVAEGEVAGGTETVLVVDDEAAVRRTTARILERFGYRTLEAADGESALTLVRAEAVDLVLLDLSMPGMSGTEVGGELRRIAPQVKVVLFTGYASESREAGEADGVIQKPFTAEAIAREIRRVLG